MSTIETEQFNQLFELVRSKQAKIGVVGLGYVGLPLINAFFDAGFSMIGFDVDAKKVESLNQSESYIEHIPSDRIRQWNDANKFDATTDFKRFAETDVILICVPTPLNESRDPDLTYVISTTEKIAQGLRPGQLVVLESTTYPGTTRDVMLPILQQSNLTIGDDFFLAYSPEREDPGNPKYSASSIPKVVGGYDANSLKLACELYRHAVVETVPVSSCEVAEACKIVENTYRSVNIALVNELKVLFQDIGINVWEVIDAAKTKPFGFQAFYPGPGLGGHCIPIDPFYLSWVARKNGMSTRFIELAGEINTSMPEYVINRVAESLNNASKPIRGSKISILGVAYKKDVDDPRESPSFKLIDSLAQKGAIISYSDPHIPVLPRTRNFETPSLQSEELTKEYLSQQDCVLIATDHSAFDWELIAKHSELIVDTRNACNHIQDRTNIVRA